MRRDGMGFQDSGVEPEEAKMEQVEDEIRTAVEETISTKGYLVLHNMFVERLEASQKRLTMNSVSEAELRYEQGRFNALSSLQHDFVQLAKTKEER